MRRALAVWIAALLLAGPAAAAGHHAPAAQPLVVDGPRRPPEASSTSTIAASPTTTTTISVDTSTGSGTSPTRPRTGAARPASPGAAPLVTATATLTDPGEYVVSRDGTQVRRLADPCPLTEPLWVGSTRLVVSCRSSAPMTILGLDGTATDFAPPPVLDRNGQAITYNGVEGASPDGHRVVAQVWGAGHQGHAIVDLDGATPTPFVWDIGVPALWAPDGTILVMTGMSLSSSSSTLYDGDGQVLRADAPAPFSTFPPPTVFWSPDGRHLIAPSFGDGNRWVLADDRTNQAIVVPQVGAGQNRLAFLGPSRVVIADVGLDHRVLPSLHVWDPASGAVTDLLAGAALPTVPLDGHVVAYSDWTAAERAIGVVSADGSRHAHLVQVPSGLLVLPVSWSPDGSWLTVQVSAPSAPNGGLPTT